MQKLFSKSAEIFRWGPIQGKFFYISDFWEVIFVRYPKKYPNYCWPKTLAVFKGGRMVWINDFNELRQMGGKVFVKFVVPVASRKRIKLDWHKKIKNLTGIEQKIGSMDLRKLSDSQLFKLGSDFLKRLYDFWMPTVVIEMGNYGSSELLETKIKKYISDERERAEAMEMLCAPEKLSFYQEEEIDLSKSKDIKKHTRKYFWLKNSYNGVEILKEAFFRKRKSKIKKNLEKELKNKIILAKKNKTVLANKFHLPQSVMQFSKALTEGIEFQDERKKHIWISLHYKRLFLEELARRKNIDLGKLFNLSSEEILEAMRSDGFVEILNRRKRSFGFFCKGNYRKELNHSDGEKYWKEYALERVGGDKGFVKGIIASPGKKRVVRARVRILLDPARSFEFQKGEILITSMTSPEYVFVIKKASAFITDEGGIMCHAAIIARELKKPCLVGTKIATQIFHDGDLVEVDTNKGIARIIK